MNLNLNINITSKILETQHQLISIHCLTETVYKIANTPISWNPNDQFKEMTT